MTRYTMNKYIVDVITFDELIIYGRDNGGNIVNGMPWSFVYKEHTITHENDTCYLINVPKWPVPLKVTPYDVVVTKEYEGIYVYNKEAFESKYTAVAVTLEETQNEWFKKRIDDQRRVWANYTPDERKSFVFREKNRLYP